MGVVLMSAGGLELGQPLPQLWGVVTGRMQVSVQGGRSIIRMQTAIDRTVRPGASRMCA